MCLRSNASRFRALKKLLVLTLSPPICQDRSFPSGYIKDFDEPSTTLTSIFSTLLCR